MRRILTGFILIKVMTLFVALVFCGCKDNVENAGFINKILNDRSRYGMFIEVKNKATQKIYNNYINGYEFLLLYCEHRRFKGCYNWN